MKIAASLLALMLPLFATAQQALKPIPIEYVASFEHDGLEQSLRGIDFLADIDAEYEGSPLMLYISLVNKDNTINSATGFTSLMLTSGSLGLIPMATNNDLLLRYELVLHGRLVDRREFAKNFKGLESMWSNEFGTIKITDEMKQWIESTVPELKAAYDANESLAALRMEYNELFVKPES